jgi:hypothetical protein
MARPLVAPPKSYIEGTDIGLDLDLDQIEKEFKISLELQTKKKRAEDYTWLLHGPPKIGKSTFCSLLRNPVSRKSPFFFRFEEGTKGLSTYGCNPVGWEEYKNYLRNLWKMRKKFKEDFPFNYFIMDTVDLMFKQCHAYITHKHKITHASDMEWGKGWEFLVDEFARVAAFVQKFQVGVVMLSHSKETEFKTRTMSVHKWQPTLTGTGRRVVLPAVDIIGFCSYDTLEEMSDAEKFKSRRIVRFDPAEEWEAGDRSGYLPAKARLNPISVLRHFPGNKKLIPKLMKNEQYMGQINSLK